jgi:LytS/YehU family sensor histidine kinase
VRKTGPLRVIIDVKGMAEVDEEDLKQQIVVLQEHFLFNTLNAIKGAAILEKVLLPELLDGFSDCLRYQFQCFRVNKTVSFREERKFMRTYLSMENYRFQGMTILWDVGDCDLKVPPMGIALYASRAVNECMSTRRRQIEILGGVCQNKYILTIRNSYEELSKKEADEGELIRQKLRIWWSFSVEGDISWEIEGDEMVVTFALPIEAEGQNT